MEFAILQEIYTGLKRHLPTHEDNKNQKGPAQNLGVLPNRKNENRLCAYYGRIARRTPEFNQASERIS